MVDTLKYWYDIYSLDRTRTCADLLKNCVTKFTDLDDYDTKGKDKFALTLVKNERGRE